MTVSRVLKGLALAGVLAVTGGCVSYPDGTVAFLPPPPPVVIAPAPGPVVAVAPAPVVVTRPVVYGGYYRPCYRPYVWGGGYRGGYYGYWGRRCW
jgi:hypothetical protein